MTKAKKIAAVETPKLLKLDLGCGPNKREGFIGVDARQFDGKVDQVINLAARYGDANGVVTPRIEMLGQFAAWPWKDGTVEEVHSSHFLEHLTGAERVHFWNELHRVLIPGGKATIVVPHWSSGRAYGDPTHQWPPVVEFSFYYLDKAWRAQNAPHVGYTCDFNVTWGYSMAQPWTLKAPEAQQFALNHYREVAQDLIATATKR